MADEFSAVYHSMHIGAYRVDHGDIAKRDLRNVCLGYLAVETSKRVINWLKRNITIATI